MCFKDELTSKKYSLNARLKLFESTVSSTMLYGCATWTLNGDLTNRVRRPQRRMLRMVLGSGRRKIVQQSTTPPGQTSNTVEIVFEPWVDWV